MRSLHLSFSEIKLKVVATVKANILDMDEETRFRFAEFDRFSEELHNDNLYIDLINEDKIHFLKILFTKKLIVSPLIKRMRETRAFIGFSRILSSTNTNLNEKIYALEKSTRFLTTGYLGYKCMGKVSLSNSIIMN